MKSDDYFRKLDQMSDAEYRRLQPLPHAGMPAYSDEAYQRMHDENAPWSKCECDICEKARNELAEG